MKQPPVTPDLNHLRRPEPTTVDLGITINGQAAVIGPDDVLVIDLGNVTDAEHDEVRALVSQNPHVAGRILLVNGAASVHVVKGADWRDPS